MIVLPMKWHVYLQFFVVSTIIFKIIFKTYRTPYFLEHTVSWTHVMVLISAKKVCNKIKI